MQTFGKQQPFSLCEFTTDLVERTRPFVLRNHKLLADGRSYAWVFASPQDASALPQIAFTVIAHDNVDKDTIHQLFGTTAQES